MVKIEKTKVKIQRWPSNSLPWMENEYPAITLVNQILGKGGSFLHLHLISFTTHLFNNLFMNPFYLEFLGIQFHANKWALNGILVNKFCRRRHIQWELVDWLFIPSCGTHTLTVQSPPTRYPHSPPLSPPLPPHTCTHITYIHHWIESHGERTIIEAFIKG